MRSYFILISKDANSSKDMLGWKIFHSKTSTTSLLYLFWFSFIFICTGCTERNYFTLARHIFRRLSISSRVYIKRCPCYTFWKYKKSFWNSWMRSVFWVCQGRELFQSIPKYYGIARHRVVIGIDALLSDLTMFYNY